MNNYLLSNKLLKIVSIFFIFLSFSTVTVLAARLPNVLGDDGVWGNILNEFLNVSHGENGTLRIGVVNSTQIEDGTILDVDISTLNWTKLLSVPVGFSDGVDNDTTYSVSGLYLYDAGSNVFSFNETYLNSTIDSRSSSFLGSSINSSEIEDGTILDVDISSLNWSKLLSVPVGFSDDVDNDTTYSSGDGITIVSTQINSTLGTIINTTEILDGTILDIDISTLNWSKLLSVPVGFSDGVDNDTTYSSGDGITIVSTQINSTLGTIINTTEILDGTILDVDISTLNWSKLLSVPVGFSDDVDNDTTYSSGNGITIVSTQINSTLGTIINTTEILDGTILDIDISNLNWSKLLSVPVGFSDGVDNDTTYSGGDGITIVNNQINSTLGTIINTTEILDGTILDVDISDTINLTLGETITFTFGEVIDNILNGWVRITGGLNVTGDIQTAGNITTEGILLEQDSVNHRIYDNSSCVIIKGDTSTMSIC